MGPYSIFGCPNGLDGIKKKKDALNGKFKLCLSMILLSMILLSAILSFFSFSLFFLLLSCQSLTVIS
jgi:hypothetical protein